MPRKTLIVANWKMHLLPVQAEMLISDLIDDYQTKPNLEVVLCPQMALISHVANLLDFSSFTLGAQNCSDQIEGALTGETSPALLKTLGCQYCIIGHSERRTIFYENDRLIAHKAKTLQSFGITPIVCVGETLEERQKNQHFEKIKTQLHAIFQTIHPENFYNLIIAYEPLWAIGTGQTASPEQANEIHTFIRQEIIQIASQNHANSISILYGGSVKPINAIDLIAQNDIDGFLVGGAALIAENFHSIIQSFSR